MDAGSLHKHIESSTRSRIHAKMASGSPTTPTFRNDGIVKAELHREELDYNGDGIVTLIEELDGIDNARGNMNSATEETEQANPQELVPPPEQDDDAHEYGDTLPQASILSLKESHRRSFNPFSSRYASAPIPRHNRYAPVEEVKPVRDNANAIIMILLIAILIIAVAIFSVIIAGDYRKARETDQIQDSINTNDNASSKIDENEAETPEYDFDSVIGKWRAVEGGDSCITISAKNKVSWVQDCNNQTGDSFSGEASIISGQDAIDKLSITKERAARTVGVAIDELSLEQTFAIIVKPDKYVVGGNEKTQKPSEIRLLLVETEDGKIHIYNYLYAELGIYSRDK